VHHQLFARGQFDEQELRATVHGVHGLSFEAALEVRRDRIAERSPPHDDARDACTRHRALQAAADILDFRKLRHPVECTVGSASISDGDRVL
jgi:predicted kinase